QLGALGDGVDRPARRAAAEHGAGRALQDLDLLVVEAVTGIGPEVPQAVDIDIVLGVEAADLELIAVERAALADGDGDAGNIAQGLLQAGDALGLELCGVDDADGLRRVLDRGLKGADVRVMIQRTQLACDDNAGNLPGLGRISPFGSVGRAADAGRAGKHGQAKPRWARLAVSNDSDRRLTHPSPLHSKTAIAKRS